MGESGSGKSTLGRCLVGLQAPDAGTVERPLQLMGLDRRQQDRRLAELLDLVRLPAAYAERYPHQLSGGEKQRVGIARTLALEPSVLVCDEATSALDVSVQASILELLKDLRDRLGVAMLFISHDLAVVSQISDRVVVMRHGAIVEQGRTDQVLSAPAHEYTRLLLDSVPAFVARRAREAAVA
ncbi:ABC transporter ATP-binding protein [Bordetella pertussis]|nr:ABC transporter ATP-binding protein [Bordetella pertussis]